MAVFDKGGQEVGGQQQQMTRSLAAGGGVSAAAWAQQGFFASTQNSLNAFGSTRSTPSSTMQKHASSTLSPLSKVTFFGRFAMPEATLNRDLQGLKDDQLGSLLTFLRVQFLPDVYSCTPFQAVYRLWCSSIGQGCLTRPCSESHCGFVLHRWTGWIYRVVSLTSVLLVLVWTFQEIPLHSTLPLRRRQFQ